MRDPRYILDHSDRDTMRDFTEHEIGLYYMLKRCSMCAEPTERFIYGPVGGASVNVECPHCKARFNVYDARGKERWNPAFGQVIREPLEAVMRALGVSNNADHAN